MPVMIRQRSFSIEEEVVECKGRGFEGEDLFCPLSLLLMEGSHSLVDYPRKMVCLYSLVKGSLYFFHIFLPVLKYYFHYLIKFILLVFLAGLGIFYFLQFLLIVKFFCRVKNDQNLCCLYLFIDYSLRGEVFPCASVHVTIKKITIFNLQY